MSRKQKIQFGIVRYKYRQRTRVKEHVTESSVTADLTHPAGCLCLSTFRFSHQFCPIAHISSFSAAQHSWKTI